MVILKVDGLKLDSTQLFDAILNTFYRFDFEGAESNCRL